MHNRAGFFSVDHEGGRHFMVMTEPFRLELCEGFDPRDAAATLVAAGWITPSKDGKASQSIRIAGFGDGARPRLYVFTPKVFTDDDGV